VSLKARKRNNLYVALPRADDDWNGGELHRSVTPTLNDY
jgi:hypothetical protein